MIKHFCDECGEALTDEHGFTLAVNARFEDGITSYIPQKELCSIACATQYLIAAVGTREPRRETWP